MKMFVPVTKKPPKTISKPAKQFQTTAVNKHEVDWSAEIKHSNTVKVSEKECNINMLSVSGKNEICAAMADSSIHIFRPSDKSTKHKTLSGHHGSVLSCNWSNCGGYVISSSTDSTVCIWPTADADKPSLVVDKMCHNFPEKNTNNIKFQRDITHAQFYYIDNFFVLASGNSLKIYKYYIDEEINDLKRYSNKSRYKVVKNFESTVAQQITSVAAPNNMYSYIILSTSSDRTLSIHDMNVGSVVNTLTDVHTRAVHALSHTAGTPIEPCKNIDMFATAAVSDGIKIWDLRLQKSVAKLSSHASNTKCDMALSPCGRYVATGTDNREVAIYDLRKSSIVQKISKLRDKVSGITFGLTSSKIYCGLQNGEMNIYSQ